MLFWLAALAPKLTSIELPWLYPDNTDFQITYLAAQIATPTYLTELNIRMTNMLTLLEWKTYKNIEVLITSYQSSLKSVTLDFCEKVMVDGRWLENILKPCAHLEKLSFIGIHESNETDVRDVLSTFQSEWWFDTRRPPVLICEKPSGGILITSMPCSFRFDFNFSADLDQWHLNTGQFDSPLIRFDRKRVLVIENTLPINHTVVQWISRMFCASNQLLWCMNWELLSKRELFEQVRKSFYITTNAFRSRKARKMKIEIEFSTFFFISEF